MLSPTYYEVPSVERVSSAVLSSFIHSSSALVSVCAKSSVDWRLQDIPSICSEAAAAHPGLRYMLAAPIGAHPLVAVRIQDTSCRSMLASFLCFWLAMLAPTLFCALPQRPWRKGRSPGCACPFVLPPAEIVLILLPVVVQRILQDRISHCLKRVSGSQEPCSACGASDALGCRILESASGTNILDSSSGTQAVSHLNSL